MSRWRIRITTAPSNTHWSSACLRRKLKRAFLVYSGRYTWPATPGHHWQKKNMTTQPIQSSRFFPSAVIRASRWHAHASSLSMLKSRVHSAGMQSEEEREVGNMQRWHDGRKTGRFQPQKERERERETEREPWLRSGLSKQVCHRARESCVWLPHAEGRGCASLAAETSGVKTQVSLWRAPSSGRANQD